MERRQLRLLTINCKQPNETAIPLSCGLLPTQYFNQQLTVPVYLKPMFLRREIRQNLSLFSLLKTGIFSDQLN